jgi:ABC-type branched-subunit amino acid transport system ATPase component
MTETAVLRVEELSVQFGGVSALSGVSMLVRAGGRHGILGPNGSGKTTLFNALTGFVTPKQGRILLDGRNITGLAPHRRLSLGMTRTFQITSLFPTLTARQNLALAALPRLGRHRRAINRAWRDEEANALADEVLETFGLTALADRPVHLLGYGEQRQLEIALGLTRGPKVLLLDEPTAGLSAAETAAVADLVRGLPESVTVVLIEHDLGVVFQLVDHLTVLYHGERIADGPAEEVRQDPRVKAVYLGN